MLDCQGLVTTKVTTGLLVKKARKVDQEMAEMLASVLLVQLVHKAHLEIRGSLDQQDPPACQVLLVLPEKR